MRNRDWGRAPEWRQSILRDSLRSSSSAWAIMETTPFVTKTVALADTSPLTVATANQETNNMGNVSVSPVGSTGSVSDGNESQSPVKAVAATPNGPKKTVLPDDYDETSGNTPHGFEGTWREHNARLATDRPLVPGHTSTPSKWPGPFYVDTPPSFK